MHNRAHHIYDFIVNDYLVLLKVLFLFFFELILFILVITQDLNKVEHVFADSKDQQEGSKNNPETKHNRKPSDLSKDKDVQSYLYVDIRAQYHLIEEKAKDVKEVLSPEYHFAE